MPQRRPPAASQPGLPSKRQLLEFVRAAGGEVQTREVAQAFSVRGDQRHNLRKMLRDLRVDGELEGREPRRHAIAGKPPAILPAAVTAVDDAGDLIAKPIDETFAELAIRLPHHALERPAPGIGDRLLVKIFRQLDGSYEGRVIRVLPKSAREVVGMAERADDGLRLRPADRKAKHEYRLKPGKIEVAIGDLVRAKVQPGWRQDIATAEAIENLGRPDDPRAVSLMTAIEAGLPMAFSDAALQLAEAAEPITLDGRTDLRDIPLVTIDGEDARDFDDAVHAIPDPAHLGGFVLTVAIADVAHYVRPGDALDRAAEERGNSVYFPDRVIPMLPEKLSNDLCSLRPREDRACLACILTIDAKGELQRWRFVRGVMNSRARLTYTAVEAAHLGDADAVPADVHEPVRHLFAAYALLREARERRGAMDLDVPERKVLFSEDGKPAGFKARERLLSHQLIEKFMIAANVAAASELEKRKFPGLYRVHDKPDALKLAALADYMRELGLSWGKNVAKPGDFTRAIQRIDDEASRQIVSQLVLRAQAQAIYHPDNIGHFGLNLRRYAHFTSPIRRYSDLIVHRALISLLKLGEGGLPESEAGAALYELGSHLSSTERRAMVAERSAYERFVAMFMQDQIGAKFQAMVASVQRFGLFVALLDSGAEGLIHVGSLGRDDWLHDEARHALIGRFTGEVYALGDKVTVELEEIDRLGGRISFRLLEHEPGPASIAAAREWASGKKRRTGPTGRGNGRAGGGGKAENGGRRRR